MFYFSNKLLKFYVYRNGEKNLPLSIVETVNLIYAFRGILVTIGSLAFCIV